MALIITDNSYLIAIADAIREKTGHKGGIVPSNFATVLAYYYKVKPNV